MSWQAGEIIRLHRTPGIDHRALVIGLRYSHCAVAKPAQHSSRFRLAGLYPFEVTALTAIAMVLIALGFNGLSADLKSVRYSLNAAINLVPLTFIAGLLLAGSAEWLKRRELRVFARQVFNPAWLLLWLRLWIACWLATYAYFWLKVYTPLINSTLWDDWLWSVDRWLHLGVQPTVWLSEVMATSGAAGWLALWYQLWLLTVVLALAFFAAGRDASLRRGVAHGCVLMWGAGCWLYLALPAWGPVFAHADEWVLPAVVRDIAGPAHELLWTNYQQVIGAPAGEAAFNHTLGIAALPSLHVGFHWLFALWARHIAMPLFWLFAVMTAATQVACVLTGWHYAVDGYAGMALAWAAYRAARALEGVPAQAEAAKENAGTRPA